MRQPGSPPTSCPPVKLSFSEKKRVKGCERDVEKTQFSIVVTVDVGTCGKIMYRKTFPCLKKGSSRKLFRASKKCLKRNMNKCDDVPFAETKACGEGVVEECCGEANVEVLSS